MFIDSNIPNSPTEERKGLPRDMNLLEDESWMMDTEVKYLIMEISRRWHVVMIFISLHDPMKMVVRQIDHYHSLQKAQTFAKIFQRGIRKDARGTLKREKNAYNICFN